MNALILVLACIPSEQYKKTPMTVLVESKAKTTEIDVAELYKKMKSKDVIIIDVRTPQEYTRGHLPKARNIPLLEFNDRLEELGAYKNNEIFLVCASGVRSQSATQTLIKHGFTQAWNVLGGTRGWQAKGFPTDK